MDGLWFILLEILISWLVLVFWELLKVGVDLLFIFVYRPYVVANHLVSLRLLLASLASVREVVVVARCLRKDFSKLELIIVLFNNTLQVVVFVVVVVLLDKRLYGSSAHL